MRRTARLALLALTAFTTAAATAADDSSAEITLRADLPRLSDRGPLAEAELLQPGITHPAQAALQLQAELRHTQRLGASLALHGNALLAHQRRSGGDHDDRSRLNEAHATLDLGAWQAAAGLKVLDWDVGQGFRPNDVVQQEQRRTQLGQTPQGRPLLMLEHFGADTTAALVLVNPQRWTDAADAQRGPREAALAARAYARAGALDLHGFARHGRHTGASLGAAIAWVASDDIELHVSARVFEAHDRWTASPIAGPLATANPWLQAQHGGGSQVLVGGTWTGGPSLSVLLEAWHDGSAQPDAAWRDWTQRNAALAGYAQQGLSRGAVAGNLAWQATPLDAPNLRRDNVYLRLAWQPADWTLAVDALFTPADRGRILSASLQWRGDRWRLDASWRVYGGPRQAVFAQLPERQHVVLAATLPF